MRRFYRAAAPGPAEGGFGLFLDARPVLTPGKRKLVLPTAGLARAVAGEWTDQGDTVEPGSMPLARLANTAIDIVHGRRDHAVAEIAGYAETDLVCYRALRPAALRRRQEEVWDPLLDWIAGEYGARLRVTAGLVPAPQPREAVDALRAQVAAFDDFALAAVQSAAGAAGSIVLALAMAAGRIDAEQTWAASLIDETYQSGRWGRDGEAWQAREGTRRELAAAARFIALSRPDGEA